MCPRELAVPDLVDRRRGVLPHGDARHELEVLEVAHPPAERDPDEVDALAEDVLAIGREPVAAAEVVRLEIGAGERGVVEEGVLEQDLDSVHAHVDAGSPVSGRSHSCNAIEGVQAAPQELALALRLESRQRLVHEAVVAQLVSRLTDSPDQLWIGEGCMAGDEERRRDVVPLEQIEDPRHGDGAELAAGKRRDVPLSHVEDPRRQRIEVEGQAHRQPGAHRPIMGQANVAGAGHAPKRTGAKTAARSSPSSRDRRSSATSTWPKG